jgi:non-specific protein-tyrosine kinase
MSVERPVSALLVSSSAASEDKSIVLANLAVTVAQAGNSTIIVDADLRRPAQHDIWGLDNTRGLTTMMTEDTAMSSPPLQATEIANLSVLTSGPVPSIPADVLSNQRMKDIIGVLKARAQYVLFDSPPVLAATDAALLGVQLDGALLVLRAGISRRDKALQAQQTLERVHVRVLGVVLTNSQGDHMRKYS